MLSFDVKTLEAVGISQLKDFWSYRITTINVYEFIRQDMWINPEHVHEAQTESRYSHGLKKAFFVHPITYLAPVIITKQLEVKNRKRGTKRNMIKVTSSDTSVWMIFLHHSVFCTIAMHGSHENTMNNNYHHQQSINSWNIPDLWLGWWPPSCPWQVVMYTRPLHPFAYSHAQTS